MKSTATNIYLENNEIDLNLTQSELISLKITLEDALQKYGVKMIHETIVESPDFHPTSHIGALVGLYRRIDAAQHGRRYWNCREINWTHKNN